MTHPIHMCESKQELIQVKRVKDYKQDVQVKKKAGEMKDVSENNCIWHFLN